jgi:hypothetical protein
LTSRKRPWHEIREALVLFLIEREEFNKLLHLKAQQAIGLQGHIGDDVVKELFDLTRADAHDAVLSYGRSALPWIKWPTEEEAKAMRTDELRKDSRELIEAWIRYFEPENTPTPAGS